AAEANNVEWAHPDQVFECLGSILPQYDRSVYALLTDLRERGLERDVAVVIWGEMGRTPRVGTQRGTVGGRDHWPQSGFCVLAGGGRATGQGGGAPDARGGRPGARPAPAAKPAGAGGRAGGQPAPHDATQHP